MQTESFFTLDANHMKDQILSIKPRWYKSLEFSGEVSYGYNMYVNCYKASLGMLVLGDEAIRGDKQLLVNLEATSVTPSNATKIIKSTDVDKINHGAILNEKYWWPFFNDCWVMGGVHGKHEFHLGHIDWPADSELWDRKNSRPKMLGRELLILSISGYTLRKNVLGMVFYNSDHMKAFGLRLPSIYSFNIPIDEKLFIEYIKNSFSY